MAEDHLESLLSRITDEGVRKGEVERDKIIAAAKAEAAGIVADAETEANALRENAESESRLLRERAESAVKQAARDVLLDLKNELEARLRRVIGESVNGALTPELMAGLIRELAAKFAEAPDAELSIRCAGCDVAKLDQALKGALSGSFRKNPKIFADNGISGGLEVGFGADGVWFDFTDAAITGLVSAYAGTLLAGLLNPTPNPGC